MGRTHSNAFRGVHDFFDLPYRPVLKAICARNAESAKRFAEQVGLRIDRDRLAKLVERKDIDADRYREPEQHARRNRDRRGQGRQDGDVRKAARAERQRRPRRW